VLKEHLEAYISDRKRVIEETVIKLISEDAPKNKFSIQAGRMKELEELESEIELFVKKQRETQGMR
jgi:hypothetical protein